MKVIIVGAGFVGMQLARTLVAEDRDVVLIDKDAGRVKEASNCIDCAVVLSDGNSPAALEEAGISAADALVAVTEQDEVNMITCSYVESHYPPRLEDRPCVQLRLLREREPGGRNAPRLRHRPCSIPMSSWQRRFFRQFAAVSWARRLTWERVTASFA